ncbi:aldo/keto reductase [Pseudonocardia adelaidensis]|uniref:aldo/keto reductase n=1 Tax=Pseudonocardia adelaidensis TaxID=648754 RepID=UPI0031EA6759
MSSPPVRHSQRRLGVETIDLLYYARIDPTVPVDETVGVMADLVAADLLRAHLGAIGATCRSPARAGRISRAEFTPGANEPSTARGS